MSLKPTSLVVSPALMKDVDASTGFNLKPPPDAVQKGVGDDASYSWIEKFLIVDSDVKFDEKDKSWVLFPVKFKVPDDTEFPTNAGRVFTKTYRVHSVAMNDSAHESRQQTIINLGRLKGIARACGFELPEGGDVDILPYFSKDGNVAAPIVGVGIYARMQDKGGTSKAGEKVRYQEPTKFVSLADGGSL